MAVANDIVTRIIADIDDSTVVNEVNTLWAWLQENTPELIVGTHIEGDSEYVTKLNEMIKAAGMTKD
jgi:hypothetical protein